MWREGSLFLSGDRSKVAVFLLKFPEVIDTEVVLQPKKGYFPDRVHLCFVKK